MIRQAHSYMVGAMSGATLIAIAIAAFVLLVSAQVFQGFPLSLGGGEGPHVSDARQVTGSGTTTSGSDSGTAVDAAARTGAAGAKAGNGPPTDAATGPGSTGTATAPGSTGAGSPGTETGSGNGTGNGGGGNTGSAPAQPSTTVQTPAGPVNAPKVPPPSQVAETVNEAVNGVDEAALGGTLKETGVTGVTEGLVNGTVGPESPVGKTLDQATGTVTGTVEETVGGLLHPGH